MFRRSLVCVFLKRVDYQFLRNGVLTSSIFQRRLQLCYEHNLVQVNKWFLILPYTLERNHTLQSWKWTCSQNILPIHVSAHTNQFSWDVWIIICFLYLIIGGTSCVLCLVNLQLHQVQRWLVHSTGSLSIYRKLSSFQITLQMNWFVWATELGEYFRNTSIVAAVKLALIT